MLYIVIGAVVALAAAFAAGVYFAPKVRSDLLTVEQHLALIGQGLGLAKGPGTK
jgi:hypothetical protein